MIEVESDGSPGCVLHVGGKSFRVDDYLATSSFAVVRRWHGGEPRQGRKGSFEDSGFVIELDPGGVPLSIQAARTAEFLQSKRDEFERLLAWPDIDYRTLDFGYSHRDEWVQTDRLSRQFIRLAAQFGLGIELSLYRDAR